MINQQKVRLMTKAALFERKERMKALETGCYRKRDYIILHILLLWLSSIAAGILMISLLIAYQVVNGTSQTVFQSSNLSLWIAFITGFLVLISAIYVNVGYRYYFKKYDEELARFKEYQQLIEQLEQFYQDEEERTGGAG